MKFVHVRNFFLAEDDNQFDALSPELNNWIFYNGDFDRKFTCYSYDWNTEYDDSIPVTSKANVAFLGENNTSIYLSQKYDDRLKIELSIIPYQDICDIDESIGHDGFEDYEVEGILSGLSNMRGYKQLYLYDDYMELCAPMYRVVVSDIKLKRINGYVVEIAIEFTADSGHGYDPIIRSRSFSLSGSQATRSIYSPATEPIPVVINFDFDTSQSALGATVTIEHEYYDRNRSSQTETANLQNIDPQYTIVMDSTKEMLYYTDAHIKAAVSGLIPFSLDNFNLKFIYIYPGDNTFTISAPNCVLNRASISYRSPVYGIEFANEEFEKPGGEPTPITPTPGPKIEK